MRTDYAAHTKARNVAWTFPTRVINFMRMVQLSTMAAGEREFCSAANLHKFTVGEGFLLFQLQT